MVIDSAELIHTTLPLTHYFQTSFGRLTEKQTVLVKLISNGRVGYGEGSALNAPLYVPEYAGATYRVLKEFILPAILHKNFNTPEEIVSAYAHIRGFNFAKTAVETAFWDLYSQEQGSSVAALLGGTQTRIQIGESIGIKDTMTELLNEVELRLTEGYKRIKVKIQPGWDVEVTRAIRTQFGDISLMLDGNSAYTLRDIAVLQECAKYDLLMLEQPLGYDDIIDHATLQKQIDTPICLDESILSAEDARKALDIGACKIINIKPGRVGGLVESKKIHDLCADRGVGVWCGGMLESCIGRFFNLSVASLPNYTYPADMSPSSIFFSEDFVEHPFTVKNGEVIVPQSLHTDFVVDEARIAKHTISKEIFA